MNDKKQTALEAIADKLRTYWHADYLTTNDYAANILNLPALRAYFIDPEKLTAIKRLNDAPEFPKMWSKRDCESYNIGYVLGYEDGFKAQLVADRANIKK